jgi:hypothetical protein
LQLPRPLNAAAFDAFGFGVVAKRIEVTEGVNVGRHLWVRSRISLGQKGALCLVHQATKNRAPAVASLGNECINRFDLPLRKPNG